MATKMIMIPEYRIIHSPAGNGWYTVERFDRWLGFYKHVASFRGRTSAENFIAKQEEESHVES